MKTVLRALVVGLALTALLATSALAAKCGEQDADCWLTVLKKGQPNDAMRAAMMLGKMKNEAAVPLLIKKLEDKDKYMATAAAYALAQIGKPAIPALIEATKHKKSSVRKYAAHSLGQIGGDNYSVLSELTRDPDAAVRLRAIKALTILEDKRAVADAVIALKDQHIDIRVASIQLLGILRDSRCVESLATYSIIDLNPEVSLEAAAVLISFGDDAIEPLMRKFPNHSDVVQTRILYVLGEIARNPDTKKEKTVKDFMIGVVENKNEHSSVKQAAVTKLGDFGDIDVLPSLVKLKSEIEGKPDYADLLQVTVRTLEKLGHK